MELQIKHISNIEVAKENVLKQLAKDKYKKYSPTFFLLLGIFSLLVSGTYYINDKNFIIALINTFISPYLCYLTVKIADSQERKLISFLGSFIFTVSFIQLLFVLFFTISLGSIATLLLLGF